MPTTTARKTRVNLDFSSGDTDQLLPALELFFGEGASYTCQHVNEQGFHLAAPGDGAAFIDGEWRHRDRPIPHLPLIAEDIIAWLGSLDETERRTICGSVPTEQAYTSDPGLSLTGFRLTSATSEDGQHRMLTIRPTWV